MGTQLTNPCMDKIESENILLFALDSLHPRYYTVKLAVPKVATCNKKISI